jgi:DNA polymerase
LQEHNLVRDKLPSELDVLDMIAARVDIEKLRRIPLSKKPVDVERAAAGRTPVSLVLARCIRPTFIAPPEKEIVWGDWKAIEARVSPWLADTRDADAAVLEPFRQSDADPKAPDVYVFNAESIFHIPADVIWERYMNGDPEADGYRKAGKVAVLALGFLGGVGALKAMARGYGMRLTDEEAKVIVDGWRDRNKWARRFGDKCEAAAFAAIRHPMSVHTAGKLKYQYAPDLMGGTLVTFLPDMRPIVYPMARISRVEKFDQMVDAITYLKGMGRRSAWSGLFVENPTQGTAASLLRGTLVRLEEEAPDTTILHTHDEVGCEVPATTASGFASQLEEVMVRGFDWSEGLPLAAEITTDWYYHK